MTERASKTHGLSRRSFLKTTAVAAGAVAVAGAAGAPLSALAEGEGEKAGAWDREVVNSCRSNCGGKCPLKVKVRQGKVVKVEPAKMPEGDELYQRICVKGLSQPQRMYDPDRLKYPMKRAEGTERGAEQWERISWNDALDLMAAKFQTAIDEYGGSSVCMWVGYGSQGFLNGSDSHGTTNIGYGRFSTKIGASSFDSAADWGGIWGTMLSGLFSTGSTVNVIGSKLIICSGGDPANSMQGEWTFIKKAMEQGARLVTIDPRFSTTAALSDQYLSIRPGTDAILFMAWCNYLMDHDLVDYEFATKGSVAPYLLKEDGTYLRNSDLGIEPIMVVDPSTGMEAPYDAYIVWDESAGSYATRDEAIQPALYGEYEVGDFKTRTTLSVCREAIKEYTMEVAAERCGMDLGEITALIEEFASVPSSFITYNGFSHHNNSHHNYKSLALLAALTGNQGQQGKIFSIGGVMRGYFTLDYTECAAPDPKPVAMVPGMMFPDVLANGGIGQYKINPRTLWFMNGNPLAMESGRAELVDAVRQVDFVVCSDSVMTDTARMADLVLPICHPFEEVDISAPFSSCPTGYFHPFSPAVEPSYECKTDMDVFRELSEKMGFGDLYDKTDEEFISAMFDTPFMQMFGIDSKMVLDAAAKGELVKCPLDLSFTEEQTFTNGMTASGRLEFYWENPAPRYDFGQGVDYAIERVPCYIDATEAFEENPLKKKYPLYGNSNHSRFSAHSQQAHTPLIRELQPEPLVQMNPIDAEARGISTGDVVRVFNDRGEVVLKAEVTEGVRPETMCIRQGWQSDHFIRGHAQDLTIREMNQFCWNSSFYDFLCEIEKVEQGA